MSVAVGMQVVGQAYIGTEESDEFWAEGEAARLEVEKTDANEVRIGIVLSGSSADNATFYLTLGEASRLAHMLGKVVIEP